MGGVYYLALILAAVALTALTVLRWPHDIHLLATGAACLTTATIGMVARRQQRPGWRRGHGVAMAASYIALLTGF